MEKASVKRMEYLKMTPKESAEALKRKGYQFYDEIGWLKEFRLQECINRGLMKFDDDLCLLTTVGAGYNTFSYVIGEHNRLFKKASRNIVPEEDLNINWEKD